MPKEIDMLHQKEQYNSHKIWLLYRLAVLKELRHKTWFYKKQMLAKYVRIHVNKFIRNKNCR